MKNKNIITAELASCYDSGTSIIVPCKVNIKTREIFNINTELVGYLKNKMGSCLPKNKYGNRIEDNLGLLNIEYVKFNGVRYEARYIDNLPVGNKTFYWYK